MIGSCWLAGAWTWMSDAPQTCEVTRDRQADNCGVCGEASYVAGYTWQTNRERRWPTMVLFGCLRIGMNGVGLEANANRTARSVVENVPRTWWSTCIREMRRPCSLKRKRSKAWLAALLSERLHCPARLKNGDDERSLIACLGAVDEREDPE